MADIKDVLQEVRLETRDGEFVHTGYMPHFNEPPAVIVWGIRVFKFDDHRIEGQHKTTFVYREVFYYGLVDVGQLTQSQKKD